MQRKGPFAVGEFYHVYNRGVDKRSIFLDRGDWERFLSLLYVFNTEKQVIFRDIRRDPLDFERGEPIVDIVAYALMPNHFHLILKERREGGISKFLGKILTSFSMYFNEKYERTGPLMCRPYRSKHIDSDEYFRWAFAYVNLNPRALPDPRKAKSARMKSKPYRYSSLYDYTVGERKESRIVSSEALPASVINLIASDSLLATSREVEKSGVFAPVEKFLRRT